MRPSARSSPSTVCSSCAETARSPSDQTTPPITAASRSSSFSAGGRRSTRAVTMPSTLSGRPLDVAAGGLHADELLGVERVAGRSRDDRRAEARRRPDRGREATRRGVPSRPAASGPSETVSAFRLPPPQSGRRSSSSGPRAARRRAAARPRRGRRGCRRSRATRRRPTGGRRTRGRAAAARRAPRGRCRQPAKSSARRVAEPDVLGHEPDERLEARDDPALAPRRGTSSSTASAELRRRRAGVVVLVDSRLRLDDLAERPERDAVAVREAAAVAPGDDLLVLLDGLAELRDEPALADSRARRRA